jgi:CheY-like chemotaxis protein
MKPQTILVVDDEAPICTLFEKALSRRGYAVDTASSAEQALDMFSKSHYWVVLSDLRLPEMDGLAMCRKIKDDFPFAVLLAMTGFVSVYDLSACREAGFEDLFIKPVNLEIVGQEVDHAFRKIARWRSGQNIPE